MADIKSFSEISASEVELVGGKGLSLAAMTRAGLPVPPGFCVTSDAYRRLRGSKLTDDLRRRIGEAYQALGGGPVAVRSSATAEDSAAASFAGQQETYLGVVGESAVCDAIERCWASLDSERARAYRQKQGVGEMFMAVVVQRLIPAESAGVLFTRDPMAPDIDHMLVEASWGLGESVVSGRVTPDRFVIEHSTGKVIERHLGQKTVERRADGEVAVSADRQSQFCLSDGQIMRLAELGRQVEQNNGSPRDIEWAWAEGQVWLLQARPITTAGTGEREAVRQEEIAALRSKAEQGGTVWGRFNLSEVLDEPTPMTWAIVRRFLSGDGGYGKMYVDLGFPPEPAMADECGYDLICGRPYMNLSREPRMQWRDLPFGHNFADLKASPSKVPYSQVAFRTEGASLFVKMRAAWRILKGGRRYQEVARTFPQEFRTKTIPAFVAEATAASGEDWSRLDPPALLAKLEYWINRTLVQYARDSLKPTAFAAGSLAAVQQILDKPLGSERARLAVAELTQGVRPDADADLAGALKDLALGRIDRDAFVRSFGHRASREMELSAPRWTEDPGALERVLASANSSGSIESDAGNLDRIAQEAKLGSVPKQMLRTELAKLQTFLALRETGKHHLMRGYALIRRALTELDRRFNLAGGIFFLTLGELSELIKGANVVETITGRRKRRAIALSIEAPPAIFSDDLEAVGKPAPLPEGVAEMRGVSLSTGVAEGPAMVLTDPRAQPPALEDYILVCPSTDPSWVPLFARAKGLVMETGGVLSHGAIVAREFGIPAVAGLAGIVRRLQSGQRIRVDGNRGAIAII